MPAPPESMTAEQLVAALSGPPPSEIFSFTKWRDGVAVVLRIRIQLLTTDETMNALQVAQDSAKKYKEVPSEYGDIYKESQAVEVVLRCLRDIESRDFSGKQEYPRLFVNSEHLRKAFNEEEIGYLLNCYQVVKSKYGQVQDFTENDIEAWVAKLGDGMRGFSFLAGLDSRHWGAALMAMARWGRALAITAGYPLPSSESGSESTPAISQSTTSSSGGPPSASSETGEVMAVPHDRVMTRDEAKAEARKRRDKKD